MRLNLGFVGLLTLIFVVAKIGGWINWSWWIVLAPAYISFILFMLFLAVVLGIALYYEYGK